MKTNNVWVLHSQLKAALPLGYSVSDTPIYSNSAVIKWAIRVYGCAIEDTLIYHIRDQAWELQTNLKSPTGSKNQLLHILTMARIVTEDWNFTN